MNFLAHLHLAEANPESRLGNLLGDFVKGLPWDDRFSETIWDGIMEHRYLDAFTDRHPAWKVSRDRLEKENRRFAGIIIDIFYDFILHRHWSRFCPGQSLEEFIGKVHRDLVSVQDQASGEMVHVLERMIREEWLLRYGEIEGIRATLQRVAASSPNLSSLEGLEVELKNNLDGFEADFLRFYPDAVEQVTMIRSVVIPERKRRRGGKNGT